MSTTPVIGGFVLSFSGIDMAPDAAGRTRIYVGTSAVDASGIASSRVGGPSLGDFVAQLPPPVPVLQTLPDPLLATYPDAMDRSTRSFTWQGTAGSRYTLLRASEYDVVAAAERAGAPTDVYAAAVTPAERAAALRSLAVSGREAFAPGPIVDADTGTVSVTDTLPGGLRALTVYTVFGRAANGSASPWPTGPDAFAVVAVPQIPAPSPPVLVRGEWKPPDVSSPEPETAVGHVELVIAAPGPGTGPVVSYEVYRTTTDLSLAEDVRRMTPLHSLTVPADLSAPPWGDELVGGVSTPVVHWRDATVDDWTTYVYRLVARGRPVPGAASTSGTRSAASRPLVVRTRATDAASASEVSAMLTPELPPTVTVKFSVALPPAPAGPSVGVVRQVINGHRVQVARERLTATPSTLSGAVLPVPQGAFVALEVSVIDPSGQEGSAMPVSAGPMA